MTEPGSRPTGAAENGCAHSERGRARASTSLLSGLVLVPVGQKQRPRLTSRQSPKAVLQHSLAFVQSASELHVAPPPLLAALLTAFDELEATDDVVAPLLLELVVLLVVLEVVVVMPPVPPAPLLEVVAVPPPVPPVPVVVGLVGLPPSPNSVEPSAQAARTRPLRNMKARTRTRRLEGMARYKYRINVGPWKGLCAIRSYDPGGGARWYAWR